MPSANSSPARLGQSPGNPAELDHQIALFRAQIANLSAHMAIDGQARLLYDARIRQLAQELAQRARRGEITWREAAREASTVRNTTMDLIRTRSTPVGRAYAQSLKPTGLDLNTLIARKTVQLFGEGAQFGRLTQAQQNQVYAAVVQSAGKSNPVITSRMRIISRAGRGLLVLSVGIAVYNVSTSATPGKTAIREGSGLAAGIGGGIAGGALAGLACGPGAPVCVTVGAFVGGALAAFGVDYFF